MCKKPLGCFFNEQLGCLCWVLLRTWHGLHPRSYSDEKYCLFGKGGGEFLANEFDIPLLAQIPLTERLCDNCDEGKLNELLSDSAVKKSFDLLLEGILTLET
jgi:ATP-binding protein involved in chromosome partitioning